MRQLQEWLAERFSWVQYPNARLMPRGGVDPIPGPFRFLLFLTQIWVAFVGMIVVGAMLYVAWIFFSTAVEVTLK